jgi:hypothetical protein
VAAAEKVAFDPLTTVALDGWVVNNGGAVAAVMVRMAPELVAEPAEFVAIHV